LPKPLACSRGINLKWIEGKSVPGGLEYPYNLRGSIPRGADGRSPPSALRAVPFNLFRIHVEP
jgi:hypothetical protein